MMEDEPDWHRHVEDAREHCYEIESKLSDRFEKQSQQIASVQKYVEKMHSAYDDKFLELVRQIKKLQTVVERQDSEIQSLLSERSKSK